MSKFFGVVIGAILLYSSLWFIIQPKNLPRPVHVSSKPVKKVEKPQGPPAETQAVTEVAAAPVEQFEKGKRLYMANCIQCHNRDPNMKGSIGPEMVDAPLEVMTSKIMTGLYPDKLPAGFVPKRKTKAMRKIPKLKDDIQDIYNWVQSVKK